MTNENVIFKYGSFKNLPSSKIPGTVYFCSDDGSIYWDVSSSMRIQLKDKSKLPLDGSASMSGSLNMGSQTIRNLKDPQELQDAVTKNYADTTYKYTVDGTALILSSNKISHSTANGYRHIPANGSSGQVLFWSSAGTAKWGNLSNLSIDDGVVS